MPIIKSAKKRVKTSRKRHIRNYATRSRVKSASRRLSDLIKDKKVDEAGKALSKAYKALDTAAKKGVLHRNAAARKKSSLAKKLAALKKAAK